jgi:hypothetical protein
VTTRKGSGGYVGEGAVVAEDGDHGTGSQPWNTNLSNKEFRLLTERSYFLDDEPATKELSAYLLGKLAKKHRVLAWRFGPLVAEADSAELFEKAMLVARLTLERSIDRPRNYVMRSVSNHFRTLVRKHVVREAAELRLLGNVRENDSLASVEDDIENRMCLEAFKKAQTEPTARKAAQVIELVYWLGLKESEVCEFARSIDRGAEDD